MLSFQGMRDRRAAKGPGSESTAAPPKRVPGADIRLDFAPAQGVADLFRLGPAFRGANRVSEPLMAVSKRFPGWGEHDVDRHAMPKVPPGLLGESLPQQFRALLEVALDVGQLVGSLQSERVLPPS